MSASAEHPDGPMASVGAGGGARFTAEELSLLLGAMGIRVEASVIAAHYAEMGIDSEIGGEPMAYLAWLLDGNARDRSA